MLKFPFLFIRGISYSQTANLASNPMHFPSLSLVVFVVIVMFVVFVV